MLGRLALAAAVALLAVAPSQAAFRRGTAASAPVSPSVVPGPGISTFSDLSTTYAGSPSDYAYTLPAIARWSTPQRVEVGYFGAAAATRQIGILAFHQPNTAQFNAGFDDDICEVDVRVDGGSWFVIPAASWNADDQETDWNFTVDIANYATDAIHRVDAIVKPCSGPSLILEGPMEYSPTNHVAYASTEAGGGVVLSDGSGTVAGNIMTVTPGASATNLWRDGWDVMAIGVEPNTRILATNADDPTLTGTGGAGTYRVAGPAQLVTANVPATAAQHRSFYFLTNKGGGLHRNVEYVRPAGNGGSDSNLGDTPTAAKATPGSASVRLFARDTVGHGMYGGVICLMDGGTFPINGSAGVHINNYYGWLDVVKAETDPRCGVAGSVANPIILTSAAANAKNAGSTYEHYSHLTLSGWLSATGGGWLEYDTLLGFGLNYNENGAVAGAMTGNGVSCNNNVILFYYSGCRAEIVRNNTMRFVAEDFFHGSAIIANNIMRDGGSVFLRVTGDTHVGSNVISNVVTPPGYTIAQLFSTTPSSSAASIDVANCVEPGQWTLTHHGVVSAVDDVAHTITLVDSFDLTTPWNATCSVTAQEISAYGVHGDFDQYSSGQTFGNMFVLNNDADDPTIGYQQGLFAEVPVNGLAYKGNHFRSQQTTEYYIQISNGQYNVIMSGNLWNEAGSSTSGFNLNGATHRFWLDMNNLCTGVLVGGGFQTYTPGGTNIRLLNPASNACR